MKLIIDDKELGCCPQHGYPLPCDKCGLGQYELGKQSGIKEVIGWMNTRVAVNKMGIMQTNIDCIEWQSKLKEWGI